MVCPLLSQQAAEPDTLEISVELRNEGEREAEETVFLFVRDKVASVSRPLLELKGYAKQKLRPGDSATVRLKLPAAELRFIGPALEPVYESGALEILVGPSADRAGLLSAAVELLGGS